MSSATGIRTVAIGFVAALGALGVLLSFVGVQTVIDVLSTVSLFTVAELIVVSLLWLLTWSLSLRTLLASLDISISIPRAYVFSAVRS